MKTTREKIAERLRELADDIADDAVDAHLGSVNYERDLRLGVYAVECAAYRIASGILDDILGIPEPTIEDVTREAVRVFGSRVGVQKGSRGMFVAATLSKAFEGKFVVRAPTVAAAYAALRALPDYEVKP